jgi:predicted 3-demethylubiquinone-9 3-methyltransferase (glyoxalase superfamily)
MHEGGKEHTNMTPKNTICLWFDKDAHEAARFYAATFPDSKVTAVHKAPGDYPSGKEGDVLTVEFTVLGIPCLGLNGGPEFRHNEAFSFQIATDSQEETDRYWNAIVGNGGQESQCGWCKDRWGLSWQITPRALTEALAAGGGEARRAFKAMMPMKKIDIATIEAARRGWPWPPRARPVKSALFRATDPRGWRSGILSSSRCPPPPDQRPLRKLGISDPTT